MGELLGHVEGAAVLGCQLDADPLEERRRVGSQVDDDVPDPTGGAANQLRLGEGRGLIVRSAEGPGDVVVRDASTVEIPWASRQELLERLRREGDAEAIIAAFEAVGATAPVKLTKEAKRRLLDICEAWLFEDHVDGLPEGIFDLRNALQDESAWGTLDYDPDNLFHLNQNIRP